MKERMKLRIKKLKVRSINRTSHFSLGNSFGFTLIELSIVLIIISLIVAGITGGKSLVRQAEVQSIITDARKIKTAMNTFRLQYNQFAGDFDEADDHWGCGPNPPSGAPAGCTGNDDAMIDYQNERENRAVFQHLSEAGVFKGDFDQSVASKRYAPTKLDGGGYSIFSGRVNGGGKATIVPFGGGDNNIDKTWIMVGNMLATGLPTGGLITTADAISIDRKLDDAIVDSGNVLGFYDFLSGDRSCLRNIATGTPPPAQNNGLPVGVFEYNPTNTETNCTIFFLLD